MISFYTRLNRSVSVLATLVALVLQTTHTWAAPPVSGVYRLTTRAQPTLCLEVAGSGNADGTTVQLGTANQSANQQWLVEEQSDGTYKIYAYSAQNSLQMLDNNFGQYGVPVHTWKDLGVSNTDDTNQRWFFVDLGNGYYRIVPAQGGPNSSNTLDIGQGDPGGYVGETTDIWTYWGSGNQQFKLDWSGPTKILPNPKKGVPGRHFNATGLNSAWVYDWGAVTPTNLPANIEYVPMVWGWYGNTNVGNEVLAANPGMRHVLSYNEPDGDFASGGSEMSVASALQGFQYISPLASLGIKIGSPACVNDLGPWMGSFLDQAINPPYNYPIDFVAVHLYPGADPNALLNYLDAVYARFGKPIWVTEFAPADWSGNNGVSLAQAKVFMQVVCEGMNTRSYIQRYSWFTSQPPSNSVMGSAALINDDGTFTELGRLYSRM